MKRTLCLLLSAIMALALVGCGGEGSQAQTDTDKLVEEANALHEEIEANRKKREERAALAESGVYDSGTKEKENVPDSVNIVYDSLQAVEENNCDVSYDEGTIYAMYWNESFTKAAYSKMDAWDSVVRYTELKYKALSAVLNAYGESDEIIVQLLDDRDSGPVLLEVTEDGVSYNCNE